MPNTNGNPPDLPYVVTYYGVGEPLWPPKTPQPDFTPTSGWVSDIDRLIDKLNEIMELLKQSSVKIIIDTLPAKKPRRSRKSKRIKR